MTIQSALSSCSFVLFFCSVVTGLVTEAVKKMVDVKRPNIVAAIASVIVGAAISIGYLRIKEIPFTPDSVLYVIGIIVLSWLIAMEGYDKVMQTLFQSKKKETDESK